MTCSWLVLTVLAQSATITYEPAPATATQTETPTQPAQTPSAQDAPAPPDAAATPDAARTEDAVQSDDASESEDAKITVTEEPATVDVEEGATEPEETTAKITLLDRPEPPARGRSLFRGAVELGGLTLPSGVTNGRQDVFVNVLPILAVDTGDHFGFELGAVLRLRVLDDLPAQRADDYGTFLRREDWDERSDFGQIVRELRLGAEDAPVTLRAGPQQLRTLGKGHLINRYSNQLNPNYHPAGAAIGLHVGPLRAEAFASDVLAARIFAGEVGIDVGRLATAAAEHHGRYHVNVSTAYDFGTAGGTTDALHLVHLDVDAALYKGESLQSFVYLGGGTRAQGDLGVGGLAGISVDAFVGSGQLGAKLEARKVGPTFRFGAFGPSYELSRFAEVGLAGPGTAAATLPSDAFSGYGELQLGMGAYQELGMSRASALTASVAAEYFTTGRLDADAAISARLAEGKGAVLARVTAVDALARSVRWEAAAEARYRFAASFYALAQGGLVYFPQPDQTLARGFFAGLGVGADFSH